MKSVLKLGFCFWLFCQSAWAIEIDRFISGAWYNPSQNGHGFSIEVISDEQTVLYWFVYHPDGTPTFILAVGKNNGNVIDADAYYNSGMRFGDFNPADRSEIPWGKIKITFNSCTSATLEYDSDLSYDGVPFGSGTIPLTRLLSIDQLQCAPKPEAGIYQGNFYSDLTGEVIPGMAAISPDGKFAAVSFDAMAAVGNWSVSGSTFSGSGNAVSADPNFTFSSNLSFSGQISPEYRMAGTYNVSGGDHGDFDFFAVPGLYRRGVSLQSISGSYTAKNLVSGGTGSASVSANGTLNGSDSFGCKYNGQLTLPDAQFNIFKVTVTVSSCGVSNGTYTGYGAQIDYYNLEDGRALRLVATNGSYAGVIDLYR